MSTKDDGGPAFPLQSIGPDFPPGHSGMSLRAYAAIQLRQPDSGIGWLDEMIKQAKLDDLAGQALAGIHANPAVVHETYREEAIAAYNSAHAMLAQRSK